MWQVHCGSAGRRRNSYNANQEHFSRVRYRDTPYLLLETFQFSAPSEVPFLTRTSARLQVSELINLPQSHLLGYRSTTLVKLKDLEHSPPLGLLPDLPCPEHHRKGLIVIHVA